MYGGYNTGGYVTNQYSQMPQNRMNQIEQQYGVGMYQQSYPMQSNQQQIGNMVQTLKGRPVSSYDEAKASLIDLDGSLYVFTDIANNCIYTKQILLDGTAELKTYVLQEQKQNEGKQTQQDEKASYVLKKEFDKTVRELKKQIDVLKGEISDDSENGKTNDRK